MSSDNDNLNSLNTILFETLREVKLGNADKERVKNIVDVSQCIINNAKTQLQAVRLFKTDLKNDFFGLNEGNHKQSNKLFEGKLRFSKSIGYENVAEAIGDLGKFKFEEAFKKSEYNV